LEGIITSFQAYIPDRRSAAGPTIRWSNSNMGLATARRKHADLRTARPAAAPIPGSAIPATLINPADFDKTRARGLGPASTIRKATVAAGWVRNRPSAVGACAGGATTTPFDKKSPAIRPGF